MAWITLGIEGGKFDENCSGMTSVGCLAHCFVTMMAECLAKEEEGISDGSLLGFEDGRLVGNADKTKKLDDIVVIMISDPARTSPINW